MPESLTEAERQDILNRHEHWTLSDDAALCAITDFAAQLCEAPIALISLVDANRQWFPAHTGIAATETPRDLSFCAHAMHGTEIMQICDAQADPRFANNALVTGEPHIRFYAGAPLTSVEGAPLGSLCVIDTKARPQGLTPLQQQGLSVMAANVMAELRLNRVRASGRVEAERSREAIQDSDLRFRTLADAMPQMVWSSLPTGLSDYFNARWCEFTGHPASASYGEGWTQFLHEDDRPRTAEIWGDAVAGQRGYEIEYRLRHHSGEYRWVLARGHAMRNDDGDIIRWFGTCTDIHEQKLSAEKLEVLSQELSHRIKNIFSVMGGLIGLSVRKKPEFSELGNELRERLMALGRAHDFVRPHSAKSAGEISPSSLKGMLAELLKPYHGEDSGAISIVGTDVQIDDQSATPLALMFHELATNAAKYGALSRETGKLRIAIDVSDDQVVITWSESGGPAITDPETKGFGTQLIDLSVVRQLGGAIVNDWDHDGLIATVTLPRSAMRRRSKT